MLLKALAEFAEANKILDSVAFVKKPIRWIVPLDSQGNFVGPGLIETPGEKNRGKEFSAPRTSLDKGVGGIAEFLADGITAIFGLDSDPDKTAKLKPKQREDREANNRKKYEHFWQQLRDAHIATSNLALESMLIFSRRNEVSPTFLRWGQKEGDSDIKAKWWVKTATGQEVALGNSQFTFQVDGCLPLLDEEKIRPYWRKQYAQETANRDTVSVRGLCLVTGRPNAPIAATQTTKIKGVPGTQSFGGAIVSFDKPAFCSYGFEQSHNAPVATDVADAYCHGLNALLESTNNSVFLGGAVLCFWAKQESAAGEFFARMLNRPDPKAVADFVKSPWAGVDRELAKKDAFYSVTLAGNAGRVVVRHWMQQTVESARENFQKWFCDLEIQPIRSSASAMEKKKAKKENEKEGMPPLAIFRLTCATVRDQKDIQTDVAAQLYHAALEGTAPSMSLLKPILAEFYSAMVSDSKEKPRYPYNESRFALLKLILNRNRKECDPMMEPTVCETADPAYNCGRLLAIFDELQAEAHDHKLEGAGVVERYYGTASSAPNSAFGILWRLHQHHLRKLKRSDGKKQAAAWAIESRITDIARLFRQPSPSLPPQFPRTFTLVEQGRFALGFYQEKADSTDRMREAIRVKQVQPMDNQQKRSS